MNYGGGVAGGEQRVAARPAATASAGRSVGVDSRAGDAPRDAVTTTSSRGGPREVLPRSTSDAATTSSSSTMRNTPASTNSGASSTTRTTDGDGTVRPSTSRNSDTIIKRALKDQADSIDDLRGRLEEALRDDTGGGRGLGTFGVFASGFYNDGYYDGGFYGGGGGGFGIGAQGTTFPDPCCVSGMATASAYCGVWSGGLFNMPCCVNGGPYLCTRDALLAQNTLDRSYPEPCCANGGGRGGGEGVERDDLVWSIVLSIGMIKIHLFNTMCSSLMDQTSSI